MDFKARVDMLLHEPFFSLMTKDLKVLLNELIALTTLMKGDLKTVLQDRKL